MTISPADHDLALPADLLPDPAWLASVERELQRLHDGTEDYGLRTAYGMALNALREEVRPAWQRIVNERARLARC